MQPISREMQAMNSILNQQQQQQQQQSQMPLQVQGHHQHLQNGGHDQHRTSQIQTTSNTNTSPHFEPAVSAADDDFLEQMLSSLPSSCSWPSVDLSNKSSPWGLSDDQGQGPSNPQSAQTQFHFDESALLAFKLRQHQISGGGGGGGGSAAAESLLLQQQLLLGRGLSTGGLRSPTGASGAGESGLLPMPMGVGSNRDSFDRSQNDIVDPSSFKSHNPGGDGSIQALYNGFGQTSNQAQHFQSPQGGSMPAQNFGAPGTAGVISQGAASGSAGGGAPPGQPRQRVRARRGQATDPHSIAERLRRERIAERMKALQELVPNANKTDKASMLDEIIDYVKFLQLQVKVLSMSRLGGAAAVAPLVADISSEGGGDCAQGGGRSNNGAQSASSSNDSMTVTEHQVAKLMEEDMGSAMQYLQGKGLCLMPISLATAISTATCHTRNNPISPNNHRQLLESAADGPGRPSSPSMSVLTVQSATLGNGGADLSVKDATSISKP